MDGVIFWYSLHEDVDSSKKRLEFINEEKDVLEMVMFNESIHHLLW